ncbi:hypothetical protein L1987_70925 [Smallanthus sonchifolius]|uniref:Uncharacterized protein n=1 Tax=Smallanthus sonchifolius TaxID=185202 RepID=A0ACB9AQY8_9ASTR|nr:hypothetical protein L1987_70925 [Smallanthus sonchifolius]
MRTTSDGFFNQAFVPYVKHLLDFAFSNIVNHQTQTIEGGKVFVIRCPCRKCKNLRLKTREDVEGDLYANGFKDGYKVWDLHGESFNTQDVGQCSNPVPSQHVGQDTDDEDLGEYTGYDQIVMESMHQNHHPYYHQGQQDPNQTAETFYTMLRQANEPFM